ncbi:MAG: hypothetical protein N2235_21540 [Fischerella sp.]|nr:hypothetical protein [Fischerella sp.]
MLILKRLPWSSLLLLLFTYITLGWVLYKANVQPHVWVLVVLAILLFVGGLTIPWSQIADYSISFFASNLRSFGVAVLGAFLFFLILAWFRQFLDILVITAAVVLVKIDFQTAGFKEGLTFWITNIFSLTGLGLGALAARVASDYATVS